VVDRAHPRDFLEKLPKDEQRAFFEARLARPYFEEWIDWLALLFRTEVSPESRAVIYRTLTEEHFTNAEMGRAGDHIAKKLFRFPVVADFLSCPELSRNKAG
jgi:hypothetical protein